MIRDCGGCNDLGAHARWCPEVHGRLAARYGSQASKAEALADEGDHPLVGRAFLWAIAR